MSSKPPVPALSAEDQLERALFAAGVSIEQVGLEHGVDLEVLGGGQFRVRIAEQEDEVDDETLDLPEALDRIARYGEQLGAVAGKIGDIVKLVRALNLRLAGGETLDVDEIERIARRQGLDFEFDLHPLGADESSGSSATATTSSGRSRSTATAATPASSTSSPSSTRRSDARHDDDGRDRGDDVGHTGTQVAVGSLAMRRLTGLCLVLLLPACGDADSPGGAAIDAASSAIDASPSSFDAGGPDASASCQAWRLVDVGLASAASLETLPIHPGRSARLMIGAFECPGDLPGPTRLSYTLENEFLIVTPTRWRASTDCAEPVVALRPVTVRLPYPATWTVQTGGPPLVIEVETAPALACGETASGCALDCDCAQTEGEACLSAEGIAGPFAACAVPCAVDRDCRGAGFCGSAADGLPSVCQPGTPECDETRPCPDDFDCQAGTCAPSFVLNNATRHRCACDADCDGLRCVFQAGAAEGSCEAVCQSDADAWCQGPHACGPASVESENVGVCGWVGD